MEREKLLQALRLLQDLQLLQVQTGSLACLGCGYEHNCSLHGCAIIRAAREEIAQLTAENAAMREKLRPEDAEACGRPMTQAERDALLEWPPGPPPNPPLTLDSATAPSRGRAELDSAQAIDAPVALSLEELREMDGEPVWVEFPKCPEASGWMLVSVNRHCVYDGLLGDCDFENCGKTWLAYRRKPEERTT